MEGIELEFQNIYKEYQPKMLRYLGKMVGTEEAKDLTQDVFIKVRKSLESFRGESKFSTWIYKIATNTALDKLRSYSSQLIIKTKPAIVSDDEIKVEPEDKDSYTGEKPLSVEQKYVQEEMNRCIHELIENLAGDFKAVVLLSEIEGLKDKEIAEVLGISLNTVKIRLHRARCALKKKLEETCNFYRNERNEPSCDKK